MNSKVTARIGQATAQERKQALDAINLALIVMKETVKTLGRGRS